MKPRLKPLEQKIIALGLAALCTSTLYLTLIHWWFTAPLIMMTVEAESLRADYQRYELLISQKNSLEQKLANVQAEASTADTLLTGTDSGAGGAQLMGLIAKAVQQASLVKGGCSISNRMPINSQADGDYLPVKVSVNIDCGVESLAQVLYLMESGHPYLFVDTLSIRSNDMGANAQSNHRVSAQILVSGYLHSPTGSETAQ